MIKLKQSTIILLITLLVLVLVTGLLTWQTLSLNGQVTTMESEVQLLEADNDRYFQLSSSYQSYAGLYNQWLGYLPVNEDEVAVFASRVEDLAVNNQLEITLHFDDFPGPVTTQGRNIFGIGTDIILTGSYQGFKSFTAELQRLNYFYRTDKLIITQNDAGDGIDATLQGVLYMREEN